MQQRLTEIRILGWGCGASKGWDENRDHLIANDVPLHAAAGPDVAVQHSPATQPHTSVQWRQAPRHQPIPERGKELLLLQGCCAGSSSMAVHYVGRVPEGHDGVANVLADGATADQRCAFGLNKGCG